MTQRTQKLDENLFRNPTAQYRGIPFWSWNCEVTEELIDEQLEIFKRMGFGGVDIHPRTGLDTEYLGEEFLNLVKHTAEKCKELGLICWLYDDDRFPSGCADGIVTRNDQRYRGRFLLLTEKKRDLCDGFHETKESFDRAIAAGQKPEGYYITAYGIRLENGKLQNYRRLHSAEEIEDARKQGQRIRYAYVRLMPEEAWFQDQAYVDTMNPEAIAEFIRVTHEAYFAKLGEYFGNAVPAIFTDEPRMGKHVQLSRAASDGDVTIPYTDAFADTMLREKGIDPLDIVPEYVWDWADGRYSANRYHYRDMTAECFVRAFMDQIGDWCREHQIDFTGHVLSEDTLGSQVFALGDCMRCYRKMDIPGIDILCDNREFAAAKQVVSVTRQMGRKGTMSELYGVTHWDCDFKTFKLQGDWQAALGITIRIPHLSHMSLKGEAKRDWPGSIFFHAPWYQQWPYLEDHFARLNTVLTRGKACVNVGVIHPVESMWLHMGPDDQTADKRREMDEDFSNLVKWLLFGTVDFDFLSEAMLPELCEGYLGDPQEKLIVGQQSYSAVIVPNMTTIRSTTLDLLEAFCGRGGQVIFMGSVPELVDAEKSDRAQRLAQKSFCIGKGRNQLLQAVECHRDVEIRKGNGLRSDNLFYQLRQDHTCKWLFVSHVNRNDQNISAREDYVIRVKGNYAVKLFDTQTGEIRDAESYMDGIFTCIPCGMYGQDSVLYQLTETKETKLAKKVTTDQKFRTVTRLADVKKWHRCEPNTLLLDYAAFKLDDGPVHPREEILRIDNLIRRQLGFAIKEERMNQPYHMKKKEDHIVTLCYRFDSEIGVPAQLAIEDPQDCRIFLNGVEAEKRVLGYYVDPAISVIALPDLKAGQNELMVEANFNQKTNLENLYILGDFGVQLHGNHPVIVPEEDTPRIGDITRQGMPFYTGNLEYTFRFDVEDSAKEYAVHIPHFAAPALGVCVDGEEKGLIAYAPHRLNLGKLSKGQHTLTVRVYGNRFNGFGTLHNANANYTWYGPNSFRTEGDNWTDSYQLKPVGILSAVEIQCRE